MDHATIQSAVKDAGFYAWSQESASFERTVFCSDCVDGQHFGTSACIIAIGEKWYLGSFGYRRWLIPKPDDVIPVVIEWLTSRNGPESPPEEVFCKYGLQEIDEEEWDVILQSHGFR